MYTQYTSQAAYGAGSEGANLEYSILSAILGNSPDSTSQGATGSPTVNPAAPSTTYPASSSASSLVSTRWPADAYTGSSQPATSYASSAGAGPSNYADQAQLSMQPSSSNATLNSAQAIAAEYNGYASSGFTQGQGSPPSLNVPGQQQPQPTAVGYDYSASAAAQAAPSSPTQRFAPYAQRAQAVGASMPGAIRAERGMAWAGLAGSAAESGAKVYEAVTKPYDYTEGYHFLMKHLPTRCVLLSLRCHRGRRGVVCGRGVLRSCAASFRFEKNDILRIVRALAIFRPSLIALQMPLSEEDEVFVEKCFQRSLIVRLMSSVERRGVSDALRCAGTR